MEKIEQLKSYIQRLFPEDPTGHDWAHLNRVKNRALYIAKTEGGNPEIIELIALLHDVSDHKFNGGKLNQNGIVTTKILREFGIDEMTISNVSIAVDQISFKGKNHHENSMSLEAQIVQDADRLDAIGAIGIARCFAYGGFHQRPIFNPNVFPKNHKDFEEYANNKSHTINHFFEKLLLLTDKMNTQTAKIMAEEKHEILSNFLKDFFEEWSWSKNKTNMEKWNILH